MKMSGIIALVVSIIFTFGGFSFASDYPNKPITLVVGYAAGGGVDFTARAIASVAQKYIDQKLIIEIKAGSGGAIAANYVAHAKPDGYTILMAAIGGNAIMPHMADVGYTQKDFYPIAKVSKNPLMLAVKWDSPYSTFEDYIGAAKKGTVNFGTNLYTSLHLAGAMAFEKAGVTIKAVPFKGGGPALISLLGGHIDASIDYITVFEPQIRAKKIRALVIFESKRDSAFPDVPTLKEKGIDMEYAAWTGVFAPVQTPQPIIRKLEEMMEKVISDPDFVGKIRNSGGVIDYKYGDDAKKFFDSEYERAGESIKKLGLRKE